LGTANCRNLLGRKTANPRIALRAALRAVKSGRACGAETQILVGLKEGDSVIVYPRDRVRDGQPVAQAQL